MVGYYRKFVRQFGQLSKPLTDLLKKGTIFVWNSATKASFQALKKALMTAPVLAMPNFSLPFTIETNASAKGIGAVLHQQSHPIAFVSKALGIKAQGLSTYDHGSGPLASLPPDFPFCHPHRPKELDTYRRSTFDNTLATQGFNKAHGSFL